MTSVHVIRSHSFGGIVNKRHFVHRIVSRILSEKQEVNHTFLQFILLSSLLFGGLDLASSLEAKFGARFSQVHQIRGKIWGVLLLQDAKIGKESQFWGHLGLYLKFKGQNLGYLSPKFLEAKFGTPT